MISFTIKCKLDPLTLRESIHTLWLVTLEWYIPMACVLWLALHVFDVILVTTPCIRCSSVGLHFKQFNHIRDDISTKQVSKQEDRFHC